MKASGPNRRAFTLVEALIAMGVVAALGGIVLVNITGARRSSDDTKLESDVKILNNALDAYVGAGGSIPSNASADQMLAKLKTKAAENDKILGFSGPFIDRRIVTVWQTPDEGSGSDLRAYFDASNGRFATRRDGAAAVKSFALDEAAAASAPLTEQRSIVLAQATSDGWVWDYTDRAPAAELAGLAPAPGTAPASTNYTGIASGALIPPIIKSIDKYGTVTRLSGITTFNLDRLEGLKISIENPNMAGISRLLYATGTAEPPSWVLFGSPFNVATGARIRAFAESAAPTYKDSSVESGEIQIEPLQLSGSFTAQSPLTYVQAAGKMVGQAQASPPLGRMVLDSAVPVTYQSSQYFSSYYIREATGANTTNWVQGPAFSGGFVSPDINLSWSNWGSATNLALRGFFLSLKSEWFITSPEFSKTIAISPTPIAVSILPTAPIGLPIRVIVALSGALPDPARLAFRPLAGTAKPDSPSDALAPLAYPSGAARSDTTVVTMPTNVTAVTNNPLALGWPKETYTVSAQGTGPEGSHQWFTSLVSQTYTAITQVGRKLVGLNILGGNVQGNITGSIYLQASGGLANINSGATVKGNIYVPGLPLVNNPSSTPADIVNKGQYFNYSISTIDNIYTTYTNNTNSTLTLQIPNSVVGNRGVIAGLEYDANGLLVTNTFDRRQIVDLSSTNNSISSDYTVKINPGSYIDGKIYRNGDPPSIPPIPLLNPLYPTSAVTSVSVVGTNFLSGVPVNSLESPFPLPTNAPSYKVTMDSTSDFLVLGDSNSTVPIRYFFDGGTWTKGTVRIDGPVEIFFRGGFTNDGVIFGSTNMAKQTVIYVTNGSVSLGLESAPKADAYLYAALDVRSNTVSVNNSGVFVGSMLANELLVAAKGTVDVSRGGE